MLLLANIIYYLVPIVALLLLIFGLKNKAFYYISSSLWLSIIALVIQYQNSGGEIFGSYFNYTNSLIYSLSLMVLSAAVISIVAHLNAFTTLIKSLLTLAQAFIVLACTIIVANLWINAYFVTNRLAGTPIIQVALMKKPDYCTYKYIFYKMSENGSTGYLCPNFYGLVPKLGYLTKTPDFLATQQSTILR
jgi:hypothetical protein